MKYQEDTDSPLPEIKHYSQNSTVHTELVTPHTRLEQPTLEKNGGVPSLPPVFIPPVSPTFQQESGLLTSLSHLALSLMEKHTGSQDAF